MASRRIRKHRGEITVSDLARYASWEHCLDEEGQRGQDENTLRPFMPESEILAPSDYCLVAADFVTNSGKKFIGWFELGGVQCDAVWHLSPEIFLPKDAPGLSGTNAIWRDCYKSTRISLSLPLIKHLSDDDVSSYVEALFQSLGLNNDSVFPVTLTPRQQIRGWPPHIALLRFERPPDDPDAPDAKWKQNIPLCPDCGKPLRTAFARRCMECGLDWE